jgi:hypothetical protein
MSGQNSLDAISGAVVPTETESDHYERLMDAPPDLLANRLTSTLIMQKGNLNLYDAVLQRFIEQVRAEYGVAPEGFKLVPIEATEVMHDAARDWSYAKYGKPIGSDASAGCWSAMVAAANGPNEATAQKPSEGEI